MNDSEPCRGAWCGKCYSSNSPINYFKQSDPRISDQEDEDDPGIYDMLWRHKAPDKDDFEVARNGDHLMCPFLCDRCVFWILRAEPPKPDSHMDRLLLGDIRRASLDAFWSRSSSTVKGNARLVRRVIEDAQSRGMVGPYKDPGPAPSWDICGYQIAVCMLIDSTKSGRYSEQYKQWDTIRRVKTSVSNHEKSVFTDPHQQIVVMEDTKGSVQRLFSGTAGSFWLSRFQQGCRLRMGQQTRQDQAISTKLMILLLKFCENKVREETDIESMEKWVKAGALFAISYVLSLRGNEGILLDIEGLQQFDHERNDLLAIPLVGKLKGSGQVNDTFSVQ